MYILRKVVSKREVLLIVTGVVLGVTVTSTFISHPQGSRSQDTDGDVIRKQYHAPKEDLHWTDHHHQQNGRSESPAEVLHNKVRVLCWVMTSPERAQTRTRHVKATWARRCNVILFMSSFADETLPAIALPVPEGYAFLWSKARAAMSHIVHNYIEQADWFLKADDDTYIIVENLRHMLTDYDPNGLHYFGRRWNVGVKQGYMSGGAGYVLSKGALLKLVNEGFSNPELCSDQQRGLEDVELGKCLQNIGVPTSDSRDAEGRERFHPFDPMNMVIPGRIPKTNWYFKYNANPTKEGPECCSDNSISFHYTDPDWMYMLEFFVYHLNPYGVPRDGQAHLEQPQRVSRDGKLQSLQAHGAPKPNDGKQHSVQSYNVLGNGKPPSLWSHLVPRLKDRKRHGVRSYSRLKDEKQHSLKAHAVPKDGFIG